MGRKPSFLAFAFARQRFKIAFGAFLLLASLIFTRLTFEARGYEQEGERVQGAVLSKRTHRGRDRTIHHVEYRFRTANGQTHEGEDTVDRRVWDSLREGDPIQVDYRRTAPDTNRLAGKAVTGSAFYQRVAAGAFIAAALVLLLAVRSAHCSYRHLQA